MSDNRIFGQNIFGTHSTQRAANRYPLWRYFIIVVVVSLCVVYAIPNLYPPDFAVQIQSDNASTVIGDKFVSQAQQLLETEGIAVKGAERMSSGAQLRLHSDVDQLRAKSFLEKRLNPTGMDRQFVVALNLAETTPRWLRDIGAKPMTLGLDLAGGIHFVLQVDMTSAIEDNMNDESQKVRTLLREADIRYLAGNTSIKDTTLSVAFATPEARDMGLETLNESYGPPNYEVVAADTDLGSVVQITVTEDRLSEIENVAIEQNLTGLRSRVNELNVSEPLVQRLGGSRIVVDLPGVQDSSEAKRILGKFATLEFRLAAKASDRPSQIEVLPYEGRDVRLQKENIVTGENVTNARQAQDTETGLPQVNITLDSTGGERLNRFTGPNIGHSIAIIFIEQKPVVSNEMVDGEMTPVTRFEEVRRLISVATIQGALGYNSRITGISMRDAQELALLLRAGALAAPMLFVEERTVGATLGAENIERGMIAVAVGFVLVLIFMLVYYKVFGFVANIALGLNLVILVAVMSVLGATLTLPGIAGIVLTVGMAVDANVLIFSRIREELKNSAPLIAIQAGYDRAFLTILDANLTTLFVALILLAIGSGPVAGFAVTLSIGIVTSMFTAIFVSRGIVHLFYGIRTPKKVWI